METLAASRFDTPIGPLRVVCSEKGLAYLELPHQNGRGLAGWMKLHAPEAKLLDRRVANDAVIDQLLEYTAGARRVFEIDLDLRATPFQLAVYKLVAVRAVGAANGANPIPLVIPCHRVIARGGALQGYAGGLELKARLLVMEGAVPVRESAQARLF
jgi:O-6-methylguanine DNA methyltransferase